jgi:hypothetical protein
LTCSAATWTVVRRLRTEALLPFSFGNGAALLGQESLNAFHRDVGWRRRAVEHSRGPRAYFRRLDRLMIQDVRETDERPFHRDPGRSPRVARPRIEPIAGPPVSRIAVAPPSRACADQPISFDVVL